jgi:hypothetical protein
LKNKTELLITANESLAKLVALAKLILPRCRSVPERASPRRRVVALRDQQRRWVHA